MKIKICHIISDLYESQLIEGMAEFLNAERFELSFIFLGDNAPQLLKNLARKNFRTKFVSFKSRHELPKAVWGIYRTFRILRPDIVHTHMVSASLAGLIAAKIYGIKNRVQTRHHSSESHDYYPHAVYYDKLNNLLSKRIIAPSQVVAQVLTDLDRAASEKIEVIHHGFDLKKFAAEKSDIIALEEKYKLADYFPVVGVISRFVHGKGIHFIIPAFKKLLTDYPQAKLVLANATGSAYEELNALLAENFEPHQYTLIKFESNVSALYKNFSIFVHVPVSQEYESFGIVYVEPLALRVPSVFTLSGVANEFIKDKKNAVVVPYQNSEAIYQAMKTILENDRLRTQIIEQGENSVFELFSIEKMADEYGKLYSSLIKL